MKFKLFATATALMVSVAPLAAQETSPVDVTAPSSPNLPVNPPPGAVVKSLGGFYMWGQGGAWDTGQKKPADPNADPNVATNPAASQPLSPDMPLPAASSATTRGAVGYVMPSGTFSPQLGSNVRAEFGLSQTTANLPLAGGAAPGVYNGITLGGCSTCGGVSGYDATEMSAKAASDYKFDTLTVTPSVTVFNSQSQQNFNGGTASALEWRDVGAKVGVDTKVDLSREVAVGVGGSYGRASRSVAVSADSAEGAGSTSPYLANGEAKLTYKPSEELSLNGFAGVSNYDNKVPGVSSSGTVDYAPTANRYYGAGATWRFGTK